MAKSCHFLLILILFCTTAMGQSGEKAPKLLGAVDARSDDVLNLIDKIGLTLEHTFDVHEDIFAIRVCSDDPLPVALSVAKGTPFLTTLALEKVGIPKSRMYYLRYNKKCPIASQDYARTEYWLIPRDTEFPEFVEVSTAASLVGYELTHAGLLLREDQPELRSSEMERLTPSAYVRVLDKIVRLLKKDKVALVVIEVPVYRRSAATALSERVSEALTYIKGNGISDYRIVVKRIYAGDKITSRRDIPLYPDITVVGKADP